MEPRQVKSSQLGMTKLAGLGMTKLAANVRIGDDSHNLQEIAGAGHRVNRSRQSVTRGEPVETICPK